MHEFRYTINLEVGAGKSEGDTGDMTPWDGVSQGDSRLIAGILGSTDGRVSQAYHRHNGITVRSH